MFLYGTKQEQIYDFTSRARRTKGNWWEDEIRNLGDLREMKFAEFTVLSKLNKNSITEMAERY